MILLESLSSSSPAYIRTRWARSASRRCNETCAQSLCSSPSLCCTLIKYLPSKSEAHEAAISLNHIKRTLIHTRFSQGTISQLKLTMLLDIAIFDPRVHSISRASALPSFLMQEFLRIGYYVNNDYPDEGSRECPPDPPQLERYTLLLWSAASLCDFRGVLRASTRSVSLVSGHCTYRSRPHI